MGQHDKQKVSITLSKEAYQTIIEDMMIFNASDNWGGFINSIIRNFMGTSDASIKLATVRERDRLTKILESPITKTGKEVLDAIVADYERSLTIRMNSHKSDSKTKKTWIHKDIYDELTNSDEYYDSSHYRNNQKGLYIKALLEDYASRPLVERERIYCKDIFDTLENCIVEKKIAKTTYIGREKAKTSTLKLKPYKLMVYNNYNYLVAILDNPTVEKGYKIYTLRLCRIQNVKKLSLSAFISKDTKNDLENTLNENGVPYLQGEANNIEVKLSPEGQNKYQSIIHLRPRYTSISSEGCQEGFKKYTFDCTPEQAKNYFFQFGSDALILSPKELHDRFVKDYMKALDIYNQAK